MTMVKAILTIDTSTSVVAAGLVNARDHSQMYAHRYRDDAHGHAEWLTPFICDLLDEVELSKTDLTAIVVGCGPGPFTGLRVGIATAQAFSHALEIPVYGVCSLDALAAKTDGEVIAISNARRKEIYWARYDNAVRVSGPYVSKPEQIHNENTATLIGFTGYASLFKREIIPPEFPQPTGLVAAVANWTTPSKKLLPLYLRRPDARVSSDNQLSILIEPMQQKDSAYCGQLEHLLFADHDPWPAEAFTRAVQTSHHYYYVARSGTTIVGYAGMAQLGTQAPYEYEIHTIGVHPSYQGRGIGKKLLTQLLERMQCGAVYLEVDTSNTRALALYHGEGFYEVGLRKHYYRNGADAYLMRKDLL